MDPPARLACGVRGYSKVTVFGRVMGLVVLPALQSGRTVGEQLGRDYGRRGAHPTGFTGRQYHWFGGDGGFLPSSSPTGIMTVAPAGFISERLENILERRRRSAATPITTAPGSTKAIGPCFTSPAACPPARTQAIDQSS